MPPEFEPIVSPPPVTPRAAARFPWPIRCIALGIALIGVSAFVEKHWLAGEPYTSAIVLADYTPPKSPGKPAYLRHVPIENYPPNPLAEAFKRFNNPKTTEAIKNMKLDEGEPIIALDVPVAYLKPVLHSGRLPVPGTPEVLAGDLTQLESFKLDGEIFHVVGRLNLSFPVGFRSYILPFDQRLSGYFSVATGTSLGSYHEDGSTHLDELLPKTDESKDKEKSDKAKIKEKLEPAHKVHGLRTRTKNAIAWTVMAGLVLVCFGASATCVQWSRTSLYTTGAVFGPLRREAHQRPGLLVGMHVLLYGIQFLAMVESMLNPVLQYQLGLYVQSIFTEGGLSYIGAAYASGDILSAAATTFTNNYLLQTVGLTFFAPAGLWWTGILPSPLLIPLLMPLPLGVLKTAFSFGFAGAVMAPTWTHIASGYWFHSITMAIELEAYVIACFVVVAWPLRLLDGLSRHRLLTAMRQSALLFVDGIFLTGLLLAVAAAYEAATLILMR